MSSSIYSSAAGRLSNIPNELKALPQWACFKFEERPGQDRCAKVPYNPVTGRKASSTDPSTWTMFTTCVHAFEDGDYDGISLMLPVTPDGLVAIDIDDCVAPGGKLSKLAQNVIDEIDSYTELSPSGTGIRIIARGSLPPQRRKDSKLGFEIYDCKRAVTMTGNRLPDTRDDVRGAGPEILRLHEGIFPEANQPTLTPSQAGTGNGLSCGEIIEKARQAKNAEEFEALFYRGDLSKFDRDDSAADLSLCCKLAFWTDRDPEQIDALFRQSALYRDKWNRRDYRERTIRLAIDRTSEGYNPALQRQHAESALPALQTVGKSTSSARDILRHLGTRAPWKSSPEPVQYLVDPVIPKSSVVMISGAPANGKSLLVLDWCIQMAADGNDVLYLDRDNSEQNIKERFEKYSSISDHFKYWGLWHTDDNGEPLEPPLADSQLLIDCIKEMKNPVIVFDTLNGFCDGDENDNTVMGRTFKSFRKLCALFKATIIVIHHTTKDGSSDYRGASAQGGAIDMGWKVVGKKDASGKIEFADVINWKTRRADGATITYKFDRNGIPSRETKTFNDHLFNLLCRNPRITEKQFEALAKKELNSSRSSTRSFLDAYLVAGKIKKDGWKMCAAERPETAIDELLEKSAA